MHLNKISCLFDNRFSSLPSRLVFDDFESGKSPDVQNQPGELPVKDVGGEAMTKITGALSALEKVGGVKKIEAAESEKPQKIAFGQAVVAEYIKLIQRDDIKPTQEWMGQQSRQGQINQDAQDNIKYLQTQLLPNIDSGSFSVSIDQYGNVEVGDNKRMVRIESTDSELIANVKRATGGSTYAEKVFTSSNQHSQEWTNKFKLGQR